MSLLKLIGIQKNTTKKNEDGLENTLKSALINRFNDFQDGLESCFVAEQKKYIKLNIGDLGSGKNYADIDFSYYRNFLLSFAQHVDFISDVADAHLDRLKNYEQTSVFQTKVARDVSKRLEKTLRVSKMIKKRDKEFNKIYAELQDKVYDNIRMINYIKESMLNLMDAFNFIEGNREYFSKYDKDITEHLLKELVYGKIKKQRVLKELEKSTKTKSPAEYKFSKTEISQIFSESPELNEHEIYVFDYSFFKQRGIKATVLKSIDSEVKYEKAKHFVEVLEATLHNVNVNNGGANIILQKNPELLLASKSEMNAYVERIEELYDIIDPNVVSGIHPSHNSEIYGSIEKLVFFINKEKTKVNNVKVLNSEEVFTDKKDEETFLNRLKSNPFAGEVVQKYLSRKDNVKTIMYEKYSAIAGEGLYIKAKFGKRRAVYKLEREAEMFNVTVITYFGTHGEHVDFFMKK